MNADLNLPPHGEKPPIDNSGRLLRHFVRSFIRRLLLLASKCERFGIATTRLGIVVVLFWIGGLKSFDYEAEGIIPFVANSPLMNFFLADPSGYARYKTPEGALVPANHEWHARNHTYIFARGLGAAIVILGLLLCLHRRFPQVAALGGFLVFGMSLVTLSFLVTTPEAWVPALGGPNHGFPFLSGAGRLVIKDIIMMGASLVVMADSAKSHLCKFPQTGLALH